MNAAAVARGVDPNNKTASIRSRHNKRMTSVPLDEIFSQSVDINHVDAPVHMQYMNAQSSGRSDNMERAISTPNLLVGGGHTHVTTVKISDEGDNVSTSSDRATNANTAYGGERIYAQPFRTPPMRHAVDQPTYQSGNLHVQIRNKGDNRDMNTVIPPPPSHRAPQPPNRTTSELVEINTNRPHIYSNVSHTSTHQGPAPVAPPIDEDRISLYESSFRPGTNAHLSKEPVEPPPAPTTVAAAPRVASGRPGGRDQEYGRTDSPPAGQVGQVKKPGILKESRSDFDSRDDGRGRVVKSQGETINSLRESHASTVSRTAATTVPPAGGLRTDIAAAIKLAADSRNKQAQQNAAKLRQAPPPPSHAPPPPPQSHATQSHAPPPPPSHAPPTPPRSHVPPQRIPTPPSSQASPKSSTIPTPPPPPPPQSQMPAPPPPPPVPSGDIAMSNNTISRPPQLKQVPKEVVRETPENQSRAALLAAVAKRRNIVDNSDMEGLAESIESRIHRSKKLQTTMYKSDQTKRQLSTPDSPGKMAPLLSEDAVNKTESEGTMSRLQQKQQQPIGQVNDSPADSASDDNFKAMAEKRRQEWLQRKTAGANGTPTSSPSRSTDGEEAKDKEEDDERVKARKPAPTPPSKHFKPTMRSMQEPPPSLGGLAHVIAQKAQRIQQGNNKSPERNNNSNDERNANSGSNGHTVTGMNSAGSQQPIHGSRLIYTSPNHQTEAGRQTRTDTSGMRECDAPPPLVAGRHAMGMSHNGTVTGPASHESGRVWPNGDSGTVGWLVNPSPVHENAIREKLSRLHGGAPREVAGDDARVSSVSTLVMMHEQQCVPQVVDISPMVDVDFIPPPLSFDSEPSSAAHTSARMIPEDSVSTVSSLSTLSTISSTDHETHDFSHFRPAVAPPAIVEVESELLALPPPPPPGFGDSPSASVDDLQADFLPPPADFGESALSSAPAVTSLRNVLKASAASPHSVDMKSFRDKPLVSWTVTDVCDWLDSLHMSEHKQAFMRDQVNGQHLVHISRARLISLGVAQTIEQTRLEQAINRATL